MSALDRRTFLRQSLAASAGTLGLTAGPFAGLMQRAAYAEPKFAGDNGGYGSLAPVPDLRDGESRLALPDGFQYRSFGVRGTELTEEATATPTRHDGMAAFPWRNGKIRLIRNHEQFQPGNVGAFGDISAVYDPQGPGGTTTLEISPRADEVRSWVSLNGTSFNCAGGATKWGTWITCEETPNGVDQQRSFLIGPGDEDDLNYEQKHGYLFEVPVARGPDELVAAEPLRATGRFAHEAAAADPSTGTIYMTEDDFGYASGFYRYLPPNNPFSDKHVADGGRLQILGVVPDGASDPQTTDLHTGQTPGTIYRVAWIDIEDPDPDFAPGMSNDEAARVVFQEGESKGAARFSRLEGMAYWGGKVFFVSTEGGGPFESNPGPNASFGFGDGYGQVWMYDTRHETLTLVFESPGPDVLDFPDNIIITPRRKTVLMCEDSSSGNMLRGLTRDGLVFDFARNNIDDGGDEFAGATFAPGGQVLYANAQSNGLTYAIWGPWNRGLL